MSPAFPDRPAMPRSASASARFAACRWGPEPPARRPPEGCRLPPPPEHPLCPRLPPAPTTRPLPPFLDLAGVLVRQRAVPAGVGVDLGAVQRNGAHLEHPHLARQLQHLHE